MQHPGLRHLAQQCHAGDEGAARPVRAMKPSELHPDQIGDGVIGGARAVHVDTHPADHVEFDALDGRNLGIDDGDDHGALRPGFPNRPALHVTRKHDMGIGADDLKFVDMAQRPVSVSTRTKVVDTAGSVVGVALTASQGGVQHADVEVVFLGGWIGEHEIVRDGRRGEALTMHNRARCIRRR